MSESEKAFVRGTDVAEGSSGERVPGRAVYEPPRLRPVGTLAELVRGVPPNMTDGLGPGAALQEGGQVPPPVAP